MRRRNPLPSKSLPEVVVKTLKILEKPATVVGFLFAPPFSIELLSLPKESPYNSIS